jgi:hypothetical protein
MSKKMFLLSVSPERSALLESWLDDFHRAHREMEAFMAEMGATKKYAFGREKPVAFGFPDGTPAGWKRVGREGACRPKKSEKEIISEIDALFWPESLDFVVKRNIPLPTGFHIDHSDGRERQGGLGIGLNIFGVMSTGDGATILIAPDAAAKRDEILSEDPDARITWLPAGARPDVPEGFVRITEAEADLILAQARVDAERRAKADSPSEAATPFP